MQRQLQETEKGSPKRLLEIRRQLRITQREMAKRLGIWANTYARWERGDDRLPPKIAILAAEYLLLWKERSKPDGRKK